MFAHDLPFLSPFNFIRILWACFTLLSNCFYSRFLTLEQSSNYFSRSFLFYVKSSTLFCLKRYTNEISSLSPFVAKFAWSNSSRNLFKAVSTSFFSFLNFYSDFSFCFYFYLYSSFILVVKDINCSPRSIFFEDYSRLNNEVCKSARR